MLGIKASEDALEQYNNMKLGKSKTAYILFQIKDSEIVVETNKKISECDNEDYRDEFVKAVKETGQPKFAVIDWNHKLLFVSWVPTTAKPQSKMKYASVKEPFVQELVGIQIKLQATDDGELNSKIIGEKTKSNV